MAYGVSNGLLGRLNVPSQSANNQFGNSYLNTGNMNPNETGQWEDYVRQLQFSQLENVTDMNSPLYQQYMKMLQKTMPGMGLNTLLGMAMAGGTGYAGGQGIAQQKAMQFNKQRNDAMGTNLGQFQTNMQGQAQGLLGSINNSFQNTMARVSQEDMFNAQNSGIGAVTNAIGSIGSLVAAPFTGGASLLGLAGMAGGGSGTAGYKPQPQQQFNTYGDYSYGGGGFNGGWRR